MKVCYRRKDGKYCDSADSWVKYPGDENFVKGPNVIGRLGGKVGDYVVVETDAPRPHMKRYDGGKLVDDEQKLAAKAQEQERNRETMARAEGLKEKIQNNLATHEDVVEFLKEFVLDQQ